MARAKQRSSTSTGSKVGDSAPRPRVFRTRALLIIDNAPLQRAAWAEFHSARKRLEKASRQLQRHEQVDTAEYQTWMYRTFPLFISSLRQLQEEVFRKARQIDAVQALHFMTGRSLKRLWKEQKEREENPEAFEDETDSDEKNWEPEDGADEDSDSDERSEGEGDDESEQGSSRGRRSRQRLDDDLPSAAAAGPGTKEAKDIYRRLVQKIHPDRGGEWTATRKRLWHEVQQAWAARDADWLARLEIDWETANDVLGPDSPLSRLRRAIEEMNGARRDTERKLREYRESPAWRFSEKAKDRTALQRQTEENFRHDLSALRRQLEYFNATIAAWEKSPSRSRPRRNARSLFDDEDEW